MADPSVNIWSDWPAPAKINLFLHITGRRDDGYHLLQTVFQFIDLHDSLSFKPRQDGAIRRVSELQGVAPEDDLVVRAAARLKAESGVSHGVDISLHKRIPMGGGLGGGSSDAATVLLALNELWQLGFSLDTLAALGLELGADVPVFVLGETAWAEGVGEHLVPLGVEVSPVVVLTPDCPVSTADVFNAPDLTRDTPPIKMHAFSLAGTHNDCEPITRREYPEVAAALDWLGRFSPPRMSGTGSSVFAFFDDAGAAATVAAAAPEPWHRHAGLRLNRSPAHEHLAAVRASQNKAR